MLNSRTCWALTLLLPLLCLLPLAPIPAQEVAKIIFDSDMSSDHDDAADIAVLHALADLGECEILACMASSQNGGTAVAFNSINTYFGRPNIPCGRRPDCGGPGEYPGTIISEFPHPLYATYTDPPLCLNLYRQVLAAQPDHSVTIVTTGYLNNLQALMASGPDAYSPLSGMDLIRQKVKLLSCAAGCYPEGDEFNLRVEPQAAYDVINNWPVAVFYDGYDVGQAIYSGGSLASTGTFNPIRRCFELTFFGPYPTWGQLMVYYAVRPQESQQLWQFNTTGRNTCFDHGDGNKGHNKWVTTSDPSGAQEQGYMIEIERFPVQQAIDTLVMNSGAPKSRGTVAPPNQPTNLRATPVGGNRIDLQWTDNAWNETGFTVERKVNGTWTALASLGAGVTAYSDTGLATTANQAYRVKAVNALGASACATVVNFSGWTEQNVQFPADHTPIYVQYQNNLNWIGGRAPMNHRVINNDSAHGQDVTINVTVGTQSTYGDLYVYFLYQDANNWYRLSAGQRPENSSKLTKFEKCVNGVISQIGGTGQPVNLGIGSCMQTWQVIVSRTGAMTFLSNDNPTGNPNPTLHTVLSVSDTLAFSGGLIALGANYSAPIWDNFSFDLTGSAPVAVAPAITGQPANSTVTVGQTATFTVAASGTAPLTYAWKRGATAVGTSSATLTIASAQAADAGSYTCTVSNGAGSATSNAAMLTVTAAAVAPAITTQPASVTVTAGQTATFTVAASGTAPLTYAWKRGATAVGTSSATLTIASAQAADAGSYVCVVSNSAGSATSSAATLTVNAVSGLDPLIPWTAVISDGGGSWGGSPSTADKAFDGDTATFYDPTTATAYTGVDVGSGNLATVTAIRFWARAGWASRMVGGVFEGSNSATSGYVALATVSAASDTAWTTLTVSSSAGYRYLRYRAASSSWCNVAEIEFRGSRTTGSAQVPAITTQPANVTVTAGQTATFTVAASGTAPLTYAWKRGTTAVGTSSATLTISNPQAANAGSYTCTVSNSAGAVTSNAATLSVNTAAVAPAITAQPANVTVTSGQTATFAVAASGTAPLTYAWKRGTTAVGTSSATLTISNAQAVDAGSYTCTVSNSAGTATSTAATLTVNAAGGLDPLIPWAATISDGNGAYGGGTASTADKAFDGNTATFYDPAVGNAWTGIDVGSGKVATVTAIRYWARAGWAGRMINGVFEGSNSPNAGYVTLATVTVASDTAWTTLTVNGAAGYRYLRFRAASDQWCNVAEVEFRGMVAPSGVAAEESGVSLEGVLLAMR